MRILMLVAHSDASGPMPRLAELLVRGLRNAGCDVSTQPWGRHSDREGGPAKLFNRARDVLRVRRAVSAARADYVIVQTSLELAAIVRDLALLAALRRRASRIVLQFHGGYADKLVSPGNRLLKRTTSLLLRLSDGVLVLSSDERRALETFFARGSFHVVSNPFEPLSPAVSTGRAEASGGTASVLFVGRLLREKGIFEAIDAVALLGERRSVRLFVAGTGPEEADLASHVRDRGLSDLVTFAGHLPPDRLNEAYRAADVFVLPTYHPEGFPTAITEAMSAGLPIVTTKIRGMADHLREGTNALFVPPRDAAAVSRALEQLLGDPALRDRMSQANRDLVAKFAPDRVALDYVGTLKRISRRAR